MKAYITSRRYPHLLKAMLRLPGYQFERCHTSLHLILKRLDYSAAVLSRMGVSYPKQMPISQALPFESRSAEQKTRGGMNLAEASSRTNCAGVDHPWPAAHDWETEACRGEHV
jgi:hypothetical protein